MHFGARYRARADMINAASLIIAPAAASPVRRRHFHGRCS